MAVPGRICAGRAGPAESALPPETEAAKQRDVIDILPMGTVNVRTMELAQPVPGEN